MRSFRRLRPSPQSANGGAANPFVIGRVRTQRFMKVMEVMVRGRIAQDEETSAARGRRTLACC
ncbi:hypothetical protein ACFYUV_31420 [Nonomuraea sp. NPDC003560]|uniref:hypothetical protein n=1 Tax=Nonomuraea sp. NPDC003560 TaxID=3364341 RepID=UPI0036BCA3AE